MQAIKKRPGFSASGSANINFFPDAERKIYLYLHLAPPVHPCNSGIAEWNTPGSQLFDGRYWGIHFFRALDDASLPDSRIAAFSVVFKDFYPPAHLNSNCPPKTRSGKGLACHGASTVREISGGRKERHHILGTGDYLPRT